MINAKEKILVLYECNLFQRKLTKNFEMRNKGI